jgi:two-component system, NarL family, nitrate/nitrite response regulator NarL
MPAAGRTKTLGSLTDVSAAETKTDHLPDHDPTCLRLALVVDQPIFLDGLRLLLGSKPGIAVVAEETTGREAPLLVAETKPDVLLIDLCMSEPDGLDTLKLVNGITHAARVIMLTADQTPQLTLNALRLGAVGVLLKSSTTELLFRCIQAVMSGEFWVTRQAATGIVEALRLQAPDQLPDPQRQMSIAEQRLLTALCDGISNKMIARRLGIAEQTVKNRLSRLYSRFCASNRLDLVLKAKQLGLLPE